MQNLHQNHNVSKNQILKRVLFICELNLFKLPHS